MKLTQGQNWKLYNGNMLDMLKVIELESIDAIITDPPYELNFMSKGWDNSGIAFNTEAWKKCFEVLKPGGYLLAFGGSRTFHRIAVAIEDAGFEIRDVIMWLYGSGFPKSRNIGLAIDKKNGVESKIIGESDCPDIRGNNYENNDGTRIVVYKKTAQNEWAGWGTSLKPSYEPIIVARKPFKGSCEDNVLKYGVGGINIDACRISTNGELIDNHIVANTPFMRNSDEYEQLDRSKSDKGRFPANTILTYDDTDYEEVCGGFPQTISQKPRKVSSEYTSVIGGKYAERQENCIYDDSGSAARYFYCAKASKRDRDEGLDEFTAKKTSMMAANSNINKAGEFTGMAAGRNTMHRNTHPTVKPTMLMQYLVRLVTPKGGTVLDPFNGSGSTGKAVMYENKDRDANYKYIGIELSEEYISISKARIEFACGEQAEDTENPAPEQMTIFDYLERQVITEE